MWFYDRELFAQQRALDASLKALVDPSPYPDAEPHLLSNEDGMIVELDPQITPRMREQLAHHTVSTNVFSDHALLLKKLDAEICSPDGTSTQRVHRILIDASCKVKALQFLDGTMKVNAGTIFPDVVGLGRFLRWHFDSLRTMLL